MIRWGRLAIASALLGVGSAVVGILWRGSLPFVHPDPWLVLEPMVRDAYSAGVGLAVGGLAWVQIFLMRHDTLTLIVI